MSTETTDLASRLLAAIEQREKEHRELAEALELAVAYEATVGSAEYCRSTTAEGLRLCQAHREIVDMYRVAKAQPVSRDRGKLRGLDHASAMGRLTTLGLVIKSLAGGYGIQEDA